MGAVDKIIIGIILLICIPFVGEWIGSFKEK